MARFGETIAVTAQYFQMEITMNSVVCSSVKALAQEIYKNKYAHPSLEDILNFIYHIQEGRQQDDFISELYRVWDADDARLGSVVREQLKRSFLEVSEIEALEETGAYQDLLRESPSTQGE